MSTHEGERPAVGGIVEAHRCVRHQCDVAVPSGDRGAHHRAEPTSLDQFGAVVDPGDVAVVLAGCGEQVIQTHRNLGYRCIAEVSAREAPAGDAAPKA